MSKHQYLLKIEKSILSIRMMFINLKEAIKCLESQKKTSLCMTGRDFPEKLLPLVDIATNMTKIKHHFDDKFLANPGIDY